MNNTRRVRFVEKDYMIQKVLNNSNYITQREAVEVVDEYEGLYCDVTFVLRGGSVVILTITPTTILKLVT